jgi:pyrroloquinoline quinone biosynthesis protein B
VSADGERWFLLNASPDVGDQLTRLPVPTPEGVRHVPVEGVVLTDAELDHTLGIVLLREARRLQITATDAVRRVIEDDSRLLPVTRAFADVSVTELLPDRPTELCYRDGTGSGLRVT